MKISSIYDLLMVLTGEGCEMLGNRGVRDTGIFHVVLNGLASGDETIEGFNEVQMRVQVALQLGLQVLGRLDRAVHFVIHYISLLFLAKLDELVTVSAERLFSGVGCHNLVVISVLVTGVTNSAAVVILSGAAARLKTVA
jgi:uncharacterized ion transporter superfamily protein YfcC